MGKLIKYDNGLRAVISPMPSMRSVAMGIWVNAGSSFEDSLNNGISHFLEHMMFKGTKDMTPFDIASSFENMGAAVNAFTSKDCTCYFVKSIDTVKEKCFSILSDIFFNSTFDKLELDKERKVIVEEINMVEDSPEDICYDLIAQSLYNEHTLGQTILGPIQNVLRFQKDDISAYMDKLYNSDNIVISMAGNINVEDADKLIEKHFLPYLKDKKTNVKIPPKLSIKSNYLTRFKDFEQSNIAIAFPSVEFNDKLSPTQAVLNMIFGGGMSSRLFQNIREQQGLAYSVYSSQAGYKNNGSFNIYLNITAKNTETVIQKVNDEIALIIKKGVTDTEFDRAKSQLISSMVFAQENSQSIMISSGKLMLLDNEAYDIDKRISDIEDVTKEGVNNFIKKVFVKDKVCAAYVGKEIDVDILNILKA